MVSEMTMLGDIYARNVKRDPSHARHRQAIMAEYKGVCHLCSGRFADSIDHLVPVKLGGSDNPENLRPAHTSCNSSKGARSFPEEALSNPRMWLEGHAPGENIDRIREQLEEVASRRAVEKARKETEAEEARLWARAEKAAERKEMAAFRRYQRKQERERQYQIDRNRRREELRLQRAQEKAEKQAEEARREMRAKELRALADEYRFRAPDWVDISRLVVVVIVSFPIALFAFVWVGWSLNWGLILSVGAGFVGFGTGVVLASALWFVTIGRYEQKLERKHENGIPQEVRVALREWNAHVKELHKSGDLSEDVRALHESGRVRK